MLAGVQVRMAEAGDMPAVLAIYSHYVLHGLATFEETPPSLEEMLGRREAVRAAGLPYLVAEAAGQVVGFAYAAPHRPRPAYRYTVEDSVYVAESMRGQGVGRLLLGELIAQCERGRWRQMVAVVGDSSNAGSIALHQSFGFQRIGTLAAVGFKLGQWVDTVWMQRPLGEGARTLPERP